MKSYLIVCVGDPEEPIPAFSLKSRGIDLRFARAKTGGEGLTMATSTNPDLLLVESKLVDMDGVTFVKRSRSVEMLKSIPIIVLGNEEETDEAARAVGVHDTIDRPLQLAGAQKKIVNALIHRTKWAQEEGGSGFIDVARKQGQTIFTFQAGWKERVAQVGKIFNQVLLNKVKGDHIVFDMRLLPEFSTRDAAILEKIVSVFRGHPRKVNILAGRHMGAIVGGSSLEEDANVFITLEDLNSHLTRPA